MEMGNFQRKSPYVQVKTKANGDTIVHIRQFVYTNDSHNSLVRESTVQFRSLFFHLRALDAQFTQGMSLGTDENEIKVAIGTK